ncbi:MAG: UDP-2,3-diacylglucosamine diphosphatase LpxI [Planctomycetota bacterium]
MDGSITLPLTPVAESVIAELARVAPMRLGLLAGAGQFPIMFAKAAREQGHSVCGVGVRDMASPELAGLCDQYDTTPLGWLGRPIRIFRRAGISHAVMAGKIEKTVLFHPFRLLRMLPDWHALRMWYRHAARDKKDDTLLMAVIQEFERDGIKFGSALDFCPNLLVKHGFLTRKKPSAAQWKDIRFGWDLAKEMGRLDVGQSVIVKDTAVIAVEAIEGTDKCIRRAGELRATGFTVIKVAKPQQDMRFDVPTIGPQTLRTMYESGGKVLAIECEKTIILEQDEVVRLADKFGIAIVAVSSAELEQRTVA